MRAVLTVNMDNADFAEGNAGNALARIFRKLALAVEDADAPMLVEETGENGFPVRDINGNRVGELRIED